MTQKSDFASLSDAPKRQIALWPIDRLQPYAANARTHSRAQIAQIAASIEEFGFTNPILVRSDGTIAAGHGRLAAAKLLKLEQVPVITIDDWTEEQFRANVLADNQLALNAGWDEELLAAELQALSAAKFDLGLIGFDTDALGKMLAGLGGSDAEDGDVPEVPVVATSGPGDLWTLGPHRLLCGDSTAEADVKRLVDGLVDMVFCDPPYNVDYGNSAKDNKMRGNDRRIMNDALGDGFYKFLHDTCVNMLMVTKGACYICMSSSELHTLQKAFIDAGGKWSTFIIWAKNTFTLGRADYQRQYEPILYGWKQGDDHYWCGARDQGDVWFVDRLRVNDLHPTMKPVDLIERAIRNSSKSRNIVLDLFGGSGTTLIAAERTGRSARLMELDPKYVDVIVERWQAETGREAILEGDGRTFAQVKAERSSATPEAPAVPGPANDAEPAPAPARKRKNAVAA